jgi:hypothetical protein
MSVQRDPVREWRHALERREPRAARTLAQTLPPAPRPIALPADLRVVDVRPLRRTRPLSVTADWRLDFGAAIRVLQRHNKLLRARFGIGWVEVAGLLLPEARRRGVSTEQLARVLAAGLRSEARERGAS